MILSTIWAMKQCIAPYDNCVPLFSQPTYSVMYIESSETEKTMKEDRICYATFKMVCVCLCVCVCDLNALWSIWLCINKVCKSVRRPFQMLHNSNVQTNKIKLIILWKRLISMLKPACFEFSPNLYLADIFTHNVFQLGAIQRTQVFKAKGSVTKPAILLLKR